MREIRRSGVRFETLAEGRRTTHSFSFGTHYDPANVGFGPLVAHNDDRLGPGAGYPDHGHVDTEIVTVVLEGVLAHRDSSGGAADLGPGSVQVQSAGSGIVHSEFAIGEVAIGELAGGAAAGGTTRFVQAWVRPDVSGGAPSRSVGVLPPVGSGPAAVAGGASALLPIACAGATLWVARLSPGEAASLPDVSALHAFVATGAAVADGLTLSAGDTLRAHDEGGLTLTADTGPGVVTTVLTWAFASC